jgi:hypothetical protein
MAPIRKGVKARKTSVSFHEKYIAMPTPTVACENCGVVESSDEEA